MDVTLHPEIRVQALRIGRESLPLLVVDNVVANPQQLVDLAAAKVFSTVSTYYPGLRAKVPLTYQQLILQKLRPAIDDVFGLRGKSLRFTDCSFSLVTTPAEKLVYLQRIPHV